MFAAVTAVAVTALGITLWLLAIANDAAPGTDQANARLDAIRTGLAAGAGAGAAVTLMLAFRRQYHQEKATTLTNRDATEQRITELYTKAVEQLGNEKAAVRLGALYALERLAQDNPTQRPTIANVICAYLRMPFPAPAQTAPADESWQQERQVRLAAQSILWQHLREPTAPQQPANPAQVPFWEEIRLVDLSGATLIDFTLDNCVVAEARFDKAIFTGEARFRETTFSGTTWFDEAAFGGTARFDRAKFTGSAHFRKAVFAGSSVFDGARFARSAQFSESVFGDSAEFAEARFDGAAQLIKATFAGNANFDRARFAGAAQFDEVKFESAAEFRDAIFGDTAQFNATTFTGRALFVKATFTGGARFDQATFTDPAWFDEARFAGSTQFDDAEFADRAWFGGATFTDSACFKGAAFDSGPDAVHFDYARVRFPTADHSWPAGWHLGDDGSGGHTLVRANGNGG